MKSSMNAPDTGSDVANRYKILPAMTFSLDARAAELLKLLVERYIQDGQPVGSRTLSRAARLSLSPATIRNVMADLDELGFVSSPHTSAGRIPTTRGYRYFVDSLLEPEHLGEEEQARIAEELLPRDQSASELLHTTSELLSELSRMAGVVTVPRRNVAVLRRIEFLPLSDRRVLAVLVVNQHEVQNRVLHVDRDYGAAELERFANAINQYFVGQDLLSLREAMLDDVQAAKRRLDETLLQAARLMEDAVQGTARGDYVFAGGANLMGFQELADIQRLRGLFDAIDRKRDILHLFDQCLQAERMQLFIGDESGYHVLDECSVVTAPYYVNGKVAGVLGVIGPTRMAYPRIIPLVAEAARVLSAGLKATI